MSLTYLGSLTIGDTIPGPVAALAIALPDLQARIDDLAAFEPSVTPPGFEADLAIADGIVANLQLSLGLGITPPSISAQLSAVATIVAELEASLSAVLDVTSLFGTAGVHGYVYVGRADQFGAALTTELAGGFPGGAPSDLSFGLVLATTIPATWADMVQIFKTLP